MDKEEFGRFIHKILFAYEDGVYENYFACLRNRIIYVNGMEDIWLKDSWNVMLKGLQNMGVDVTHDDVKNVIMNILGDLRRIKGC